MMFGWASLAAHRQFHLGTGVSSLVGMVVGFATMAATAYLFQAMMKLHRTFQMRSDRAVELHVLGAERLLARHDELDAPIRVGQQVE